MPFDITSFVGNTIQRIVHIIISNGDSYEKIFFNGTSVVFNPRQ